MRVSVDLAARALPVLRRDAASFLAASRLPVLTALGRRLASGDAGGRELHDAVRACREEHSAEVDRMASCEGGQGWRPDVSGLVLEAFERVALGAAVARGGALHDPRAVPGGGALSHPALAGPGRGPQAWMLREAAAGIRRRAARGDRGAAALSPEANAMAAARDGGAGVRDEL